VAGLIPATFLASWQIDTSAWHDVLLNMLA
jgi:hypothetical protein